MDILNKADKMRIFAALVKSNDLNINKANIDDIIKVTKQTYQPHLLTQYPNILKKAVTCLLEWRKSSGRGLADLNLPIM